MITFKKIKYRNFLSAGNSWLEYDFEDGKTYLIHGVNAAGKSILIDALMFALFNKAFRNINLDQLVNSINNKDTEVEVEFSIGNIPYRIKRGIKPSFLDIYINGKLKEKEGDLRSQQKFLESQILKMNDKTFKQIVVLGSREYTPFMKLAKSDRRTVVEDLLSLSFFQDMAVVTQTKQKALAQESSTLNQEIRFLQKSLLETKTFIESIKNTSSEFIQQKQKVIEENQKKIDELRKIQEQFEEKLIRKNKEECDRRLDEAQKQKFKLIEMNSTVESSIKRINSELEFFKRNDICPKCHQTISDEFKTRLHEDSNKKLEKYHECVQISKDQFEKINQEIDAANNSLKEIDEIQHDIEKLKVSLKNYERIIESNIKDIQNHSKLNGSDLTQYQEKMINIDQDLASKKQRDFEIILESKRLNYIFELVKDGGIRSRIIDQYLPVINKLVYSYLQIMESDIDFSFDKEFKEKIKSRYRDEFTYASFSEGQKLRIDLCLLFAWREISRMRNSAATNLIVFDEIGDSSLDSDGFDCFMKILKQESGKQCAIIISHAPEKISNKVDRIYEYELQRGFTVLKNKTINPEEASLT